MTVRTAAPAAPSRAMVLAAGLGTRMRPITDTLPKPLVEVAGRSLLDRALDSLAAAGVRDAVVNLHHLPHLIEARLAGRRAPRIAFSREPALLDTGGGTRQALGLLGDGAFFVVNSDALWLDGSTPALARMARHWDPEAMDALLLLHPAVAAHGYESEGPGDYFLAPDGRARRRRPGEVAPFLFAGVSLCTAALFDGAPDGAFSLRLLWDRAEEAGRLHALRHDGEWFHVGTPEALAETEAFFGRGGRPRKTME